MRGVNLTGWSGLLLGIAICGCGGSNEVPTFPVEGTVVVKGEPAAGALVVLHPLTPAAPNQPETEKPRAQVQPDGTFKLTTRADGDGAPAGDYAVTIQWWKLRQEGKDAVAGPNVVPPAYSEPKSSPLKVTIREGENKLEPFQIR